MLWWESVAPLGNPVVPEVYWMLMGSSAERAAAARSRSASSTEAAASSSWAQEPPPIHTTSVNAGTSPAARTSCTMER